MNLKTRIERIEMKMKRHCGCAGFACVEPGSEVNACQLCSHLPTSIILPKLEDFAAIAGIPRNAKVYAGFNPDRV